MTHRKRVNRMGGAARTPAGTLASAGVAFGFFAGKLVPALRQWLRSRGVQQNCMKIPAGLANCPRLT